MREAGFVVAGIGLGGLIFNLVLPGLLRRASRATVMRLGGCVIAIGMVVVATGATWPIEMAGFTIIGLGFYMLHTGIQIEATELAPDARGSAVALHAFSLFSAWRWDRSSTASPSTHRRSPRHHDRRILRDGGSLPQSCAGRRKPVGS